MGEGEKTANESFRNSTLESIELVARRRMNCIEQETCSCYPGTIGECSFDAEGRAIIRSTFNGRAMNIEFIGTIESWCRPERMLEHRMVLQAKSRLVVVAPERCAMEARSRMLELNYWWLLCYIVLSYDREGDLTPVGRPDLTRFEPGHAQRDHIIVPFWPGPIHSPSVFGRAMACLIESTTVNLYPMPSGI
jgi:hypothetical protein